VSASSSGKPWWRRWLGSSSERAAARYLRRQGWSLLRRNYTCPYGEIDIVALEGSCIVFVEVRSTGSGDEERPAASVDKLKQQRLTKLALHFLQQYRLLDRPARFDVLTVTWPASSRNPSIVHYRQAFEAVGRFQMYS
jgi:putative endonuclease